MAVWNAEESNSKWEAVIDEASGNGPQIITLHGMERAILLSVADYRALAAHAPDLRAYLLGGPKVDSFEVERSCDTGRNLNL
jgi:antitoxin Phd